MIGNLLINIGFMLLGGLLYRLGGYGKPFNTKVRDLGVPTVMGLYMYYLGLANLSVILCFGLLFGSLTTYFKPKGMPAQWYHWMLCGLVYGLSMLPWAWQSGHWGMFAIRTLGLVVLVPAYSCALDDVNLEEGMRGVLIIGTLAWLGM